ncbi:alpha/beta hydrolase [soil metagenome]
MRAALAVAVVTLLIDACAPAPSAPRPRVQWSGCGDGLECATVTVPVDRSAPDGPTLQLAVARYPAAGQRSGSLFFNAGFFNPGGPGLSGVEALRSRGAQLAELGAGRFDIVSWDPRGSGASAAISCTDGESATTYYGAAPVPADAVARTAQRTAATDFARRCGAFNNALLAHVTTAATARDLDRLRDLIGEARLNFYGESYGTFLGQTYANLFPERVRAMVLDGVVDPVVNTAGAEERLVNSMTDTSHVFAEFGRLCNESGPQHCALPRAHETLAEVLDRLVSAPLPTPVGTLTYGDALVALHSYLGTPARWPEMAQGLAEAAAGDGMRLLSRAKNLRAGLAASIPPATGITCVDSPARVSGATWAARLGQFTALDPIYGPLMTWWQWVPCASWPVSGADVYAGPWSAATEAPVLVIGTTTDPSTPYRNARAVADLLGNAALLTHDGFGHPSAADPSHCVTAAVRRYLLTLDVPPADAVCPSDHLPFDPDFGR